MAKVINQPDEEIGASLLHYLTALDETDLVQFLIQEGSADPNLKVKGTHYTPIVIAAARGLQKTCQILNQFGVNLIQNSKRQNLCKTPKSITPRSHFFDKHQKAQSMSNFHFGDTSDIHSTGR